MQISVKVIPRASRNYVKTEETRLKVYVTAPADKGKANQVVIGLLSEYFQVSKNNIHIVKGERAQLKIIEVGS